MADDNVYSVKSNGHCLNKRININGTVYNDISYFNLKLIISSQTVLFVSFGSRKCEGIIERLLYSPYTASNFFNSCST